MLNMTPGDVGPYLMVAAAIGTAVAPYWAARRSRRNEKQLDAAALMGKMNDNLFSQWKDALDEVKEMRGELTALRAQVEQYQARHEDAERRLVLSAAQRVQDLARIADLEQQLTETKARTTALEVDKTETAS